MLRGADSDGAPLTFGVRGSEANELLRIEHTSNTEASLFLNKELDREVSKPPLEERKSEPNFALEFFDSYSFFDCTEIFVKKPFKNPNQ